MSHTIRHFGLKLMVFATIFTTILPIAHSDDSATYVPGSTAVDGGSSDMTDIKNYLLSFGANLGYNLAEAVSPTPTQANVSLINPPTVSSLDTLAQTALFTLFGAIPSGCSSTAQSGSSQSDCTLPFLFLTATGSGSVYAFLNTLANLTFPSYNTPTTASSTQIGVIQNIDQPYSQSNQSGQTSQTYLTDPGIQSVLNLIGTPDYSWCMDSTGSTWTGGNNTSPPNYPMCVYLPETQVMWNVLAAYPTTPFFSSTDTTNYSPELLNSLNADTLIAPLIYSTTTSGSSTVGLAGNNQVEQAASYVRYATGLASPPASISQSSYASLLAALPTTTAPTASQLAAQEALESYLTGVRVYAAKSSFAINNLYKSLSMRLPQTPQTPSGQSSGGTQTTTSQAMTEMVMATRRLYDPNATSPQWIDSINTASPATVQKEMALLLSEINYQLYLSRQQDERLLITNSLLLLQLINQNPVAVNTSGLSSTGSGS